MRHACDTEHAENQGEETMKLIALAGVAIAAALGLIWRGIALYRYAFHKKDL